MTGDGSRAGNPVSLHRTMKTRCVVVTVVAVVLLGLVLFLGLFFGLRSGDTHVYRRAAVATDAGPCSIVGRYHPPCPACLSLALTPLASHRAVASPMFRCNPCSCPAWIINA